MSTLDDLIALAAQLGPEALAEALDGLPDAAVEALLSETGAPAGTEASTPATPLAQAQELDEKFVPRDHLVYLSDRITQALADVEAGTSRRLIVEMPPRMGKTTMATIFSPLLALRRHPEWPCALVSHDATLATSWGRAIRRHITQHDLGIRLAPDSGAASIWETINGGSVLSVSIGGSFTGRGARLLVIDDPHKDFADAHSQVRREAVWNWWLTVAQLRLEPPSLVIVIMTRWHEDDLVGRLLSTDKEGDPADWEVIRLPALADSTADPLGRAEGEPLLSPLIPAETPEAAARRWEQTRRNVGEYSWSALMQQAPSPAKGAIFDTGWWRYWTTDPAKASRTPTGELDPRGRVVLWNPAEATAARWLDSWDMAFKGLDTSDYVVGQRWCRVGARKFLVCQSRDRRAFSATLALVKRWSDPMDPLVPFTSRVHERLVEDKANGTAVLEVLKTTVPGLHPVNPTDSKEGRARAVSPDVEAGDVFLPLPSDPGNEWVLRDYIPELRDFPTGAHDDQADATSQALTRLRVAGVMTISNPDDRGGVPIDPRARQHAAAAIMNRVPGRGARLPR